MEEFIRLFGNRRSETGENRGPDGDFCGKMEGNHASGRNVLYRTSRSAYNEGSEKAGLKKVNILRWRSHPIFWNRAMESVIESQSSDGGSHDLCRGSQ